MSQSDEDEFVTDIVPEAAGLRPPAAYRDLDDAEQRFVAVRGVVGSYRDEDTDEIVFQDFDDTEGDAWVAAETTVVGDDMR